MSENKHTSGTWHTGIGGSVITDSTLDSDLDDDEIKFYGGHLICESIRNKADATLIAAAPDLLEACMNLENDDQSIPSHAWDKIQAAIKKATLE